MRRKRALCLAILIALFLFDLYLAYAVPYSATDDLQWGMEEGLRWWLGGLLNGRYVGNFFAVIMCRASWVKALVMGGTMFALPTLMAHLAARGNKSRFLPLVLACHGAILLMPPVMWQELYGWVSGFGNYVLSALFFLIWLTALEKLERERKAPKLWAFPLFLLSLAMGLFVENLTVLFLGASLLLTVYALWNRELLIPFGACLLGSALAVILMFGNGLFHQLADTGTALNGLRELTFSPGDGLGAIVASVLGWYFKRLLPIAFIRGFQLALPMGLITAGGFWNSKFRPLCLLGLFPVLHTAFILKTQVFYSPWRYAASCISWGLPLLALLVQKDGVRLKCRRLLLFLAAPLSLLPLAATTTLGQRLYFFPMAMLILSAADTGAELLCKRPTVLVTAALALGLSGFWGYHQTNVLRCTLLREQLIAQAVAEQADTLTLPTSESTQVVCYSLNPWNGEYASYFRRFYGVDKDVTLIFLPAGSFETWPQITPEQWEERMELLPNESFVSSLP